jgi:8-amino-7-oxononanoate synthase
MNFDFSPKNINESLEAILNKRREEGSLRYLRVAGDGMMDFGSNDYLGLAGIAEISKNINGFVDNGATGSRLLSGNKNYHEVLENYLAEYFESEATLLFNSGYLANLGLLSSVPQKGDTVLFDDLSHMCIKEGVRLSRANYYNFRHNDLENLESKIKRSTGHLFVVVESVYSMDGDRAPLIELADLCDKYGAHLIVDEAHTTGLYSKTGNGLCSDLGIADRVFARIFTFGKAIGAHGAAIAGSKLLVEYLINYSRHFVYTTALNYHSIKLIENAVKYRSEHPELLGQLEDNIALFKKLISPDIRKLQSEHPIQGVVVPGLEKVRNMGEHLYNMGFDLRPIVSPTVPLNEERIRICLHSFNTKEEISQLCEAINHYDS